MAKYSEEFKIKLVTEYLHGDLGYKLLAKKYNMPSQTPLQDWVRAFKTQGIEGLKRKKVKEAYSIQFKLDTIQFMLETGASYQETADQFRLNNPSLIHRWMKTFNEQGIEGLNLKSKGRPSMSKKPNKKKNENKKLTREEELERENELLRLEVAYLKKLRAFRENPSAFHEKHKQRSHSNSKKKGSD
ncbi:helix-turn-helix domain-containing protein [Alkalihalobacterium alkalinitrilicum]|uniref:helix-turn-helix domain-containing protein n=1 Tax=Alkalihalobacterium alkalinitrilicum TaxID=427920 RepID=UPI000995079B|nr:helix-turn-helix domain-containing protein [Alkalihalobacterium alkalinitrilicum]